MKTPLPPPSNFSIYLWSIKLAAYTFLPILIMVLYFPTSHVQIADDNLESYCMGAAIFIFFILRTIDKCFQPHIYKWLWEKGGRAWGFTLLPFLSICLLCFEGIDYLNQHNVTSPAETLSTKIISQRIEKSNRHWWSNHRTHYTYYYSDIETPHGTLHFSNDYVYNNTKVGDEVILKVQKGNLGYYFVTELSIPKYQLSYSL